MKERILCSKCASTLKRVGRVRLCESCKVLHDVTEDQRSESQPNDEELRTEYERANGEEFFGITFDEFSTLQKRGLTKFLNTNSRKPESNRTEDYNTGLLRDFMEKNGVLVESSINHVVFEFEGIFFKFAWFSPPNKHYAGKYGWRLIEIDTPFKPDVSDVELITDAITKVASRKSAYDGLIDDIIEPIHRFYGAQKCHR